MIQGQTKLFTVISTGNLCQSDGREYSLYMRAWLTVFTLRWYLATLMLPLSAAGRLWEICCTSDVFPATRAERPKRPKCSTSKLHFGRVRSVSCHTSCESVVHCHSAPLPDSRYQAHTSSHAAHERAFFSSAKGVTLRESPLSLAKRTKTRAPRQCQQQAICSQQPNIFLTSWRRTTTILTNPQAWKQGSFHWFLPRIPSDQKNGGSASTLLVLQGEQGGRWSFSPRRCAFSNRSCAHCFAPKWPALTAPGLLQSANSLPRAVLRALRRSLMLACWNLNERRRGMRWNTAGIDRENVLACSERAYKRMPLILKRNLKFLGGFIGNGEPPPPPPLYASVSSKMVDSSSKASNDFLSTRRNGALTTATSLS